AHRQTAPLNPPLIARWLSTSQLHSPYLVLTTHHLPLFFFLIPRPPRSTLFPYTTLFRSPVVNRALVAANCVIFAAMLFLGQRSRSEEPRLNSSHVAISYAVFCLKKKNSSITRSASPRNAPTEAMCGGDVIRLARRAIHWW